MAGGQEKVLRRRIRTVQATKKITRAFELIAASQIVRAQNRLAGFRPYLKGIAEILAEAAADAGHTAGRVLGVPETPERVLVLAVVADRGLCGAYNANVFRQSEELFSLLRQAGKTPTLYVVGRKALAYFSFRNWKITGSWTGFSEKPAYANAEEIVYSYDYRKKAYITGLPTLPVLGFKWTF